MVSLAPLKELQPWVKVCEGMFSQFSLEEFILCLMLLLKDHFTASKISNTVSWWMVVELNLFQLDKHDDKQVQCYKLKQCPNLKHSPYCACALDTRCISIWCYPHTFEILGSGTHRPWLPLIFSSGPVRFGTCLPPSKTKFSYLPTHVTSSNLWQLGEWHSTSWEWWVIFIH